MKKILGAVAPQKDKKIFSLPLFLIICLFLFIPLAPVSADLGTDLINAFLSGAFTIIVTFLYYTAKVGLYLVSFIVYFGAWLVDVMLNPVLYENILNSRAIEVGWRTVRDFCNMFYVFFLLLIAFATITRNQAYSAKGLLPKLLISIFLINFSAVIAKIVIDFGQVFLFGFASWLGTFSGSQGGAAALTSIVEFFKNEFARETSPSFAELITIIFAVIYVFTLGFLYIMLALFLFIRLIMFAFLIIVSPFAFFSMVLPSMRQHTSNWWKTLFNNAIAGPVLMFFIYISAVMARDLTQNPIASETWGDTSKMAYMTDILNVIIPHMVAMGMLFAAIPAAKQAGIAGSGQIIGGKWGGLGKVMAGTYMGYKMGEKAAKKTVTGTAGIASGTASRAAALGVPGGKYANDKIGNFNSSMKTKPLVGTIFIKHAAEKAEESEKKIEKEKSQMQRLSNKDRKAYVEQAIDPLTRATRAQAHVELLAKDSGKNMSDASLKGMGYDKDFLAKTYGKSKTFGLSVDNIEKYRPDVMDAPDKKEEQIKKAVKDGVQGSINASALKDDIVRNTLKNEMGEKEFYKMIENKATDDKFELAESMVDDKLRPGGILDAEVANFVAILRKGGKAIERDAHNNRTINPATGKPVLTDASLMRTFSPNPTGAVAPISPDYENFVRNLSSVGVGDFSKEQIVEMLPHLKRTHLSNSNKMAQEKKDEIIAYHYTPYTTAADARAAGRDEDVWKYIDTSKEWKG